MPPMRNPLGVEADRLMRAQRVQALSRAVESARETGDARVESWAQAELTDLMGPSTPAGAVDPDLEGP